MTIRSILRRLTPPLLADATARWLVSDNTYAGPYPSWALAAADASGYSDNAILDSVAAATLKVLGGQAQYEQDGVAFTGPAPATAVLNGILLGAALDCGRLSVIDFGGSLGSHYLKWRRYFDLLESVCWEVIEQVNFVEAGRAIFQGSGLPVSFRTTIPHGEPSHPSVLLIGSALQYLEFPLEALGEIREIGARVLIIDRTPFAVDGISHILVQHVPAKIYAGSYPLQTLSRAAVFSILGDRYRLVEEFANSDSPIKIPGFSATFHGSIWIKREPRDH